MTYGFDAPCRVAGMIDGVEVNLALMEADVLDDVFCWAGASPQRRPDARPDDTVAARLAPVAVVLAEP